MRWSRFKRRVSGAYHKYIKFGRKIEDLRNRLLRKSIEGYPSEMADLMSRLISEMNRVIHEIAMDIRIENRDLYVKAADNILEETGKLLGSLRTTRGGLEFGPFFHLISFADRLILFIWSILEDLSIGVKFDESVFSRISLISPKIPSPRTLFTRENR